jgi:23S rRNA (uracil1939-C5)-methyltransferase
MQCKYSNVCSGCDQISLSYSEQRTLKLAQIQQLLPKSEPQFQSLGEKALRSRLDFVLDHGKMGLYSHKTKQTEDLPVCLQLTPQLQAYYSEFRKIAWPSIKGSFRLRVGPQGERGAWLDFANLDIQNLLQIKTPLLQLMEMGAVEIGQKHKRLIRKDTGKLGLADPQMQVWSSSFYQGKKIPLKSTIASFTQPSHITNAWITEKIHSWVKQTGAQNLLEFGAGFGNLSFPALINSKTKLTTLELDPLTTAALKTNAETYQITQQIQIEQGDFRHKTIDLSAYDCLLLNPARNGVGNLLKDPAKLPSNMIYMSCFPETLSLDTQSLNSHGYSLKETVIVDQFPQTSHMEVLSFWCKA